MTGRPVRVTLANDVQLVLEGLKALLAPYSERIEVVGVAVGDPEIALTSIADGSTDILLIDSFAREAAGIDAARTALAGDPRLAVVVFTEADDLKHLFAALRLGVRGYLLKTIDAEELVSSLERIAAGEVVVDRALGTQAAMLAARTTSHLEWEGAHLGLSRREAEVLQLLARGMGLDAIGVQLGIGRETTRTHLRQIYRKLGVHDRAGAVATAWREGLGA